MVFLVYLEDMNGKFIVFEGGEGCGKTTQLERLYHWLTAKTESQGTSTGAPIIVSREPGGTEIGKKLRQMLLTPSLTDSVQDRTELLLYAADRAQHTEEVLKPALSQGALVLCDRYTDSTIAYQGYGRGLSLKLITQLNQIATAGLESDLTLWLDLDVEVGLARVQQRLNPAVAALDRMEQAALSFHQRVRQGFQHLAQQYPQRIVRIDANQPEATVASEIQAVVKQRLREWH